jgi:hypothetical protein
MRLDTFLLADAASAPPDGKIYVHGGGITRIDAPMLPFTLQLGIVIRLVVSEDELREAHHFSLAFTDRAGAPVHPTMQIKSEPLPHIDALAEGEERIAQLALNVGGLTFRHEGPCTIEFAADGVPLKTMTLAVVAAF